MIFCLVATPVLATEASDLAKLVITAYGGPDVIEQSKSFTQSGTLDSNRHGKTGTVERTFSRPDKLRIDIEIPGEPHESRVLNGDQGWRDGKPVPKMMARAMYLQAARLDLPYLIMQAGEDLDVFDPEFAGETRTLKGVEVPMGDGLRLIAIIDTETGYIVHSRGLISVVPGHEMEFATDYAGHGDMGGMVLASEEIHFVRGQTTGATWLDKAQVVQDLADTIFGP